MKGTGNFVPVFAMLIGAMNVATAGDYRVPLRQAMRASVSRATPTPFLLREAAVRRDMPKVIVGCARYGSNYRPRNRRLPKDQDKLDALPKRESSRHRVETYDYKCEVLRDHLGPLRRYLKAQVGRPWDKIWSEICADLHPRSTMHQHVRDHVLWEVEREILFVKDGEVWVRGGDLRRALTGLGRPPNRNPA